MSTFKSYLTGFLISLGLTLLAFFLAYEHVTSGHLEFTHEFLRRAFVVLALVQATVQLIFFLHLTKVSRFSKAVFISTVGVMVILVVGSLWIMEHLNYNMTPMQMDEEMLKMEGMGK